MEERLIIQVPSGAHKMRLEDFLLDHFSGLSKMYLRDIVKREDCEINGRPENIGYRVRTDDLVEIVLDPDRETAMRPQSIPLEIVYEDNDIIVVNKPSGMLVHPSHRENSGTMLNALAFHLNDRRNGSRVIRPGLPHRLDKQTSGLIVVAKNTPVHRILSAHFMKKRVEKRYLALVDGIVTADEAVIEAPIGRYEELKHWSVKHDGKQSTTWYWVRERRQSATLIELEPITGRTNQLRIHCESIGHPIVGDVRRGGRHFIRLCLHAFRLGFPHPTSNEPLMFETQMPLEFSSIT